MEEIQKRVLIASGIIGIGKKSIPIKDLMNYINITTHKLRKNNYIVEKVNENDIFTFLRMYLGFTKTVDGNILIEKEEYTFKILNKHFLNNLSEDLKKLLRIEIKYNMPIIFNNNIVVYSFFSQERLKNILYYDELNNAFLISFKDISYNEFLDSIIENSDKIKKITLKIDEMLEFKSKIDCLIDSKYSNIEYAFKMDINKDKLSKYSDYINIYHNISKENTNYLEENNKIKQLLSTLKRKI